MEALFATIIIYVLIPGALAILILGSLALALAAENKIGAIAGWLAGIVLFVFFVLYNPYGLSVSATPLFQSIGIQWPWALGFFFFGLGCGFVLKAFNNLGPLLNLLILVFNFMGLAGLYIFYVVRDYNSIFLSILTGTFFGLLMYFVLFYRKSA